jgi:hypothetical protein
MAAVSVFCKRGEVKDKMREIVAAESSMEERISVL